MISKCIYDFVHYIYMGSQLVHDPKHSINALMISTCT